ncbi:uncharacterized protein LY79DRAFT_272309 [Colletotrichum navitas]|uniref:Uncharacterized protein n=1 Tax=Colletotrichum navitas TaxID=681940 RepID=A0AAD8PVB0_9PEZI|nr:uncharacterized protein LY79DRAFT_272309 [Colletotrichum navitas]KAK1585362.1 hypothetical protein LY79DRAFT_272309 [Colletotrichum navitas]
MKVYGAKRGRRRKYLMEPLEGPPAPGGKTKKEAHARQDRTGQDAKAGMAQDCTNSGPKTGAQFGDPSTRSSPPRLALLLAQHPSLPTDPLPPLFSVPSRLGASLCLDGGEWMASAPLAVSHCRHLD